MLGLFVFKSDIACIVEINDIITDQWKIGFEKKALEKVF